MTLLPRRALLGIAAIALAGCGFKPLYDSGPSGGAASPAVTDALASVQIPPIADRDGMKLRELLRERLQPGGAANNPRYVLDVQMRWRREELGVRRDATASHANLIYTARLSLSEGGRRIYSDVVQSVVSYNILDDQYATVAAEGSSRERAIGQLGEDIKLRLAIFLDGRLRQTAANQ